MNAAAGHAGENESRIDLLVLGAGPGGYSAAFRAADLGRQVTLVERYPSLGGVCLNVGCIPSKAMLHVARVLREAEDLHDAKALRGRLKADPPGVRRWALRSVEALTRGLQQLAAQRGVTVIQGQGQFVSAHVLEVAAADNRSQRLHFDQAIIAAGSQAVPLPGLDEALRADPRILDSTSALRLAAAPRRLLVIGGGIIGLEMATVYAALGARITIVELAGQLIPGCDPDIVQPLQRRLAEQCDAIHVNTSVRGMKAGKRGLRVHFSGAGEGSGTYDAVLAAIGREPNGRRIGAARAGVQVDARGFIPVDDMQRSNVGHIFAVGDITGPPLLAHKASHEGKVAAEAAAGRKSGFERRRIPSVAYTDPELAWVGLSETEAKARGLAFGKGVFPWQASGRALAMGRGEGLTKLLFAEDSRRILGMAAVGANAGELVAEATLALEMGCDVEDLGLTIHPHPTLSETLGMAAEVCAGTVTDLYLPGQRRRR